MKIISQQNRVLKRHFLDEIDSVNLRLRFTAEQLRRQEDTASIEYRCLIAERMELLWRRHNAFKQLTKLESSIP